MTTNHTDLPRGLRFWFLIHFAVDILFGIPLLFFPEALMPWFGWETVDPVTSRLVGAALIGIGGESLLSRNAKRETFQALLNLKIIWASGAILGIGLGIAKGGPPQAWVFLGIFAVFWSIWVYFRWQIS
jgi:hypothetical protein